MPHNLLWKKILNSHHRRLQREQNSGSHGMVDSEAPTVKHSYAFLKHVWKIINVVFKNIEMPCVISLQDVQATQVF